MTAQTAIAALLEAWSACGYDPALAALHFPRYAFRELCPPQTAGRRGGADGRKAGLRV